MNITPLFIGYVTDKFNKKLATRGDTINLINFPEALSHCVFKIMGQLFVKVDAWYRRCILSEK